MHYASEGMLRLQQGIPLEIISNNIILAQQKAIKYYHLNFLIRFFNCLAILFGDTCFLSVEDGKIAFARSA